MGSSVRFTMRLTHILILIFAGLLAGAFAAPKRGNADNKTDGKGLQKKDDTAGNNNDVGMVVVDDGKMDKPKLIKNKGKKAGKGKKKGSKKSKKNKLKKKKNGSNKGKWKKARKNGKKGTKKHGKGNKAKKRTKIRRHDDCWK